jgi:hypothetical protein
MEWNEREAYQILSEAAQSVRTATKYAGSLIANAEDGIMQMQAQAEELGNIIANLSAKEISVSRQTPWITRSEVRDIIALTSRIKNGVDVQSLVRMCLDLTNQSRIFLDLMSRYGRMSSGRDREADIEDYLTSDQIMTLMEWVEEGKQRRLEVTNG